MIGKPLHLIVWEDIEALAREGIAESTYLEFKSQPIQETLEIARDISSMSNGGGGYLVLGVPELNGVAQAPIPFPNGEAEGRRIVQVVAAGVSPPLRAIESRFLASPAGGDVVVVRVPRSRIPAMVHFQGRTEFWVRRDRQRVPMAHAEIVDRIRLGVEEMRNREEFRDKRLARCGAEHRGGIQMVLIATPHIPPGESAVPVESPDVQAVIRDRSDDQRAYVWGVRPQPSLSGIVGIIDGYTFEIHRDGYVEVRHRNIDILEERMPVPQGLRPLSGYPIAATIVVFIRRVRVIYERSGIYEPFTATISLIDVRDTLLPRNVTELGRPWAEHILTAHVTGYVEDANDRTARILCDRVWQAYGHWGCEMFDAEHHFQAWPER